jgi:hypothetical protein
MATALEESVPSILPPESGITRKKVLNMDTLHDCRYVNRGDLAILPKYAKELFLEGLALHLKRTQNITDIPVDPQVYAMDGKYGRIAEMIEELFPDTEEVEHPAFADLETDMANYFVAAGLNSIGILTGGGMGRLIASWIVNGKPDKLRKPKKVIPIMQG